MKKTILPIIVILSLIAAPLCAETIYSWKDKDGVLRFSNEPPPEHITEYQATQSDPAASPRQDTGDKRRSSYDQMVKQASQQAEASRKEREEEASAKAERKKRIAEEKLRKRIQDERKKLNAQIEAIKRRAVSPTYPNGMKQAQIDELTKALEKLGKSPDQTNQ